MKINDIQTKQSYINLLNKKIMAYLWDFFYKPLFKAAKITRQSAINEKDVILEALTNGDIIYANGGFIAKKKFSNVISKQLIKLGAVYDKFNKKYIISYDRLPNNIVNYIQKSEQQAQIKLDNINQLLNDFQINLDHYVDLMLFDSEVQTIIDDSGKQIRRNVKHLNIIEADLSVQSIEEIKKNYTTNMQYYIKKWAEPHIIAMRQQVQQAIVDGYREDQIVDLLRKQYNIGVKKAKFLAHNETSIMLAEYKKQIYQEMGFDEFIWKTMKDGRERLEHKKLDGRIFRFDNPPIIDERTGQRGLPGETYNCRCNLIPYRRDSVFSGV